MTSGRWPAAALAGIILATAASRSDAADPVPLKPGESPVAGSTEAQLWYGMDQAEKDLRASPMLVRDPALNAYVRGVACKVTGEFCPQLRVYVVDAPVFNAAMAPNGVMLVFTGALLRMHDESELAVVLAHEFAHYRQRHTLKYWQKAKRTTAFMATFSVVTYAGGVSLVGGLAQLAGFASLFSMSRDSEREADRIGFARAVELGYDPQAGVRVWTRMLAEEKATRQPRPSPVFASHPRTDERLADVRTAAAAAGGAQIDTGADAYHTATRPFLEAWLEAELSRRIYTASMAMIQDALASSRPDSRAVYTFYLAEAHRRSNKGNDRKLARSLYAQALQMPGVPAAAHREMGMVLRDEGRRADAAAALRKYLELSPQAADRAFVTKYLSDLESTP